MKLIASKRDTKSVTVEEFRAERERRARVRSGVEAVEPKFFTDVSDRYRFKRPTQRLRELDFNIGNKIQEIKMLPNRYDNDNIGIKKNYQQQQEQQRNL